MLAYASERELFMQDLRGGADSILLRFDRAARLGFDAGNENASEHVGQDGGSARGWADKTIGNRVDFNTENTAFIYRMIAALDEQLARRGGDDG